ncbi:hypothetical protein [Halorubrum kocurii]|uniref:hypothetical protein n=1 Tax=Halorubrum kocurii TaxID=478441 RepID=UPI0014614A94|nr:hypothetical protein [Halorubrum kocurii]
MHRHHGGYAASTDSKFGFEFETLRGWAALVEIDAHETSRLSRTSTVGRSA